MTEKAEIWTPAVFYTSLVLSFLLGVVVALDVVLYVR